MVDGVCIITITSTAINQVYRSRDHDLKWAQVFMTRLH